MNKTGGEHEHEGWRRMVDGRRGDGETGAVASGRRRDC